MFDDTKTTDLHWKNLIKNKNCIAKNNRGFKLLDEERASHKATIEMIVMVFEHQNTFLYNKLLHEIVKVNRMVRMETLVFYMDDYKRAL